MAVKHNFDNPLPNSTYINKDFQTIYPELLDLAKKISYKWDPSVSDESDPGVVLLKLCAIIADKNNFNIDNNILECFPETVSQGYNARPLFEQLGYSMKWYRSAMTEVSMKWIGTKSSDKSYTIPKFTMISNYDSEVVYTLTSEVELPLDGGTVDVTAIEGTVSNYSINGDTLITPADLTSNNRLYFSEINVAENGIFINNSGTSNYNDWHKVDNLSVEEYGKKIYKFGVDRDESACYIEFPDDIEDLMGVGINIHYILSSGYNGNIGARVLEQFYNDVSVEDKYADEAGTYITLNSENVKITNVDGTLNGRNVETIEEAYRNYKKTIGTFNTLVSTRDYENYINTLNKVSNCVISDRTNDVQNSYHIMSVINDVNRRILQIEQQSADHEISGGMEVDGISSFNITDDSSSTDSDMTTTDEEAVAEMEANRDRTNVIWRRADEDEFDTIIDPLTEEQKEEIDRAQITEEGGKYVTEGDKMLPYDLKIYALKWTDVTSDYKLYNASFDIISFHDYDGYVPPKGQIVIDGIIDAEYGDLADVKCVQHNFIYHDPNRICVLKNKYPINVKIIPQYKLTDLQREDVENNIKEALYNALNAKKVDFGDDVSYDFIFDTISGADERIKSIALDTIEYTTYAIYYDNETDTYKEVAISDNFADAYIKGQYDSSEPAKFKLDDSTLEFDANTYYIDDKTPLDDGYGKGKLGSITNYIYTYNPTTEQVELYSNKINKFRLDIYAKSVLNGNTQLLIPDNKFKYGLEQTAKNIITDVEKATTNVDIYVENTKQYDDLEVTFELVNDNKTLTQTVSNISEFIKGKFKIQYYAGSVLVPIVCGDHLGNNYYDLVSQNDGSVMGVVNFNTGKIAFNPLQYLSGETVESVPAEGYIINSVICKKVYYNEGNTYDLYITHHENDETTFIYCNVDDNNKIVGASVAVGDILTYTCPYVSSIDTSTNGYVYACVADKLNTMDSYHPGTYTVRKNECIQLTAPNLMAEETFANYVKYQFQLNKCGDYTASIFDKSVGIVITVGVAHLDDTYLPGYYKFTYDITHPGNWIVHYFDSQVSYATKSPIGQYDATYGDMTDSTINTVFGINITYSSSPVLGTAFSANIGHSVRKVIKANTVYELQSNESITFYWRADNNSDYTYRKYVEGDVICPSFQISSDDNTETTLESYEDTQQHIIKYGYTSYYVGEVLNDTDGEGIVPSTKIPVYLNKTPHEYTLNEYISTLLKDKYVLSGDRQIKEMVPNTVTITDSTNRCYWILNSVDSDDMFVLFKKDQLEYTLQTGEYFIYQNSSGTSLNLLGVGTKIIRSKIGTSDVLLPEWKVSKINYDDVVSEGINGVESWFVIPSVYKVEAMEMQYYALNAGSTIRLTPNSNMICSRVHFNNGGYEVIDIDGNVDPNLSLKNFFIEYKEETGASYTAIQNIDVSTMKWDGKSVYSLDVSSEYTQKLLSNQSIIWYKSTYNEYSPDTYGTLFGNDELPLYIETNQAVTKDGGIDIDIYTKDSGGTVVDTDFYVYNVFDDSSNENVFYQGDYTTIQFSNKNTTSSPEESTWEYANIRCKLPKGKYIIPLKHSSETLEELQVFLNGSPLTPINSNINHYSVPNIYYLSFEVRNISGTNNVPLLDIAIVAKLKYNSTAKIIFDTIFKYSENYKIEKNEYNMTEGDYYRLLNKIMELDINKKYNYAYIVDEDEEIENPLDAESFVDPNHIFNKFTICQMDTENTDIYITNKIK